MLKKIAFEFRRARTSDIPALAELERISFPEDEAATFESMLNRCEVANEFFMCFYDNTAETQHIPIGFVNGTCSIETTIHHESMSTHHANGRSLVIHSVTVNPQHRRQGLGLAMLIDYVQAIKSMENIDRILLLSKAYLLSFYTSCGFTIDRLSSVSHGKVSGWHSRPSSDF